MYVESLHIYNLRCFGKAVIDLRYPGKVEEKPVPVENVTLLLGNNGAGKTTILKALALATLSPMLMQSGLVPYHLVRRPVPRTPKSKPYEALVKAVSLLHEQDVGPKAMNKPEDLLARLQPRGTSNYDLLVASRVPKSRIADIDDDNSPSFFAVGYGATRRVEAGDEDSGSRSKRRTSRYQRVAGLFEDHVALRPMERWLTRVKSKSRLNEVIELFNALLPSNVRFKGEFVDGEYIFHREGVRVPFGALSDGYRAFIGWTSDLIGHLHDCCDASKRLDDLTGLVLVDEIDLHLHPEWQRLVVPTVSETFPKLQFVFSTHSPIVAGTLTSRNIRVLESNPDGSTDVKEYGERIFGLGAEQVLLSSYFDMKTTRAPGFEDELDKLARRAARGDGDSAIAYLQRLAGSQPEEVESSLKRRQAVRKKSAARKPVKPKK
jgi:energy-coupling factor transporter ATP-binding protein EcfA2